MPLDANPLSVRFCSPNVLNGGTEEQYGLHAAYQRVMCSRNLILGPEVEAFEREWAAYCGKRYAVGVGNGFDALVLMLRAFGIGPGRNVLVPSNTYIATWLAVSAVGANIIAIEPDEATHCIDPNRVAEAGSHLVGGAILAVHLYGNRCDMASLRKIATEYGVPLLVDAAQAHGLKGEDLGDAAAFSFYPTKNLGALGDAGAVVLNDEKRAQTIRSLRNYGSTSKNVHTRIGVNSRLDELQAAFLRAKLPLLDGYLVRRAHNAERYGAFVNGVHHHAVIRSEVRGALRERLAARGIETLVHYPLPPHRQPAYEHLNSCSFPIAEKLAREVLSLPCGPELTAAQVESVAIALEACRG